MQEKHKLTKNMGSTGVEPTVTHYYRTYQRQHQKPVVNTAFPFPQLPQQQAEACLAVSLNGCGADIGFCVTGDMPPAMMIASATWGLRGVEGAGGVEGTAKTLDGQHHD